MRTIFGNRRRPRDEESPERRETPPQSYEVALLTFRVSNAAAVVSVVAAAPCVTAPPKRGKSPAKGNIPYRLMKFELLTLRVSIVFVVRNRAAVVSRRCAECAGMWCMAEPGIARQCFVAPVRAPLSVPARMCPCATPPFSARVLPVLCLLSPTPRPCLLQPHAFSCPFVASGSWRSTYVPRVSGMVLQGGLAVTIFLVLSPFRLSKTARKSQGSRAPWHSL